MPLFYQNPFGLIQEGLYLQAQQESIVPVQG